MREKGEMRVTARGAAGVEVGPNSNDGDAVSGAVSCSVRQGALGVACGAAVESNGEEVEGVLTNPSKCNVSKYKLPSHSSLLLTDTLVFTDAALTGSALRSSP